MTHCWKYIGAMLVAISFGCDQTTPVKMVDATAENGFREKLVLKAEPDNAISLHDVYDELSGQDAPTEREVIVVGRVGGLKDPDQPDHPKAKWTRGFAEFMLVDPAGDDEEASDGEHASHHHDDPDHECPFCSAGESGITTVVRCLDDQGEIVPVDSRSLFGFQGNDVVVVTGRARLEPGTMLITASSVYVRP